MQERTQPREKSFHNTPLWWALGLLGAVAVAVLLVYVQQWWRVDYAVYRFAGDIVLHGGDLYQDTTESGLYFTYTPFAALLFTPFALGSLEATSLLWAILESVFLALAVWVTLAAVQVKSRGHRAALTVSVVAAALLLGPVDWDLRLGQINILLMLLVLVDLVRGDGRRWQGIGIGIAAGIKLVPLIYIGYLAVTGRLRAAATAAGAFVATVVVGYVLLPGASAGYWFGAGMAADRIGVPQGPFNQSLRGVFARLLGSAEPINITWLVTAAVVGCAGLVAAVALHRAGHTLRGMLVCVLTALLVSPVSWVPHWVWVVPLLIIIGSMAIRGRSLWWAAVFVGTAAVFGLRLWFWVIPLEALFPFSTDNLNMPAATQLAVDGYAIAALVLIVILAWPVITGYRKRTTRAPESAATATRTSAPRVVGTSS